MRSVVIVCLAFVLWPSIALAVTQSTEEGNLFYVQDDESVSDVVELFQASSVAPDDDSSTNVALLTRFMILVDDLDEDYVKTASSFPRLHIMSRVAAEFGHETSLRFIVAPRSNHKLLSILNFHYDLTPNAESDIGTKRVHLSQMSTPVCLFYDFGRQKAFRFLSFETDANELEIMASLHRFVGKSLSGDWPSFMTLQDAPPDGASVSELYKPPSRPLTTLSNLEDICSIKSVCI